MNAPDIKTALPGPKAKAIIESDAKFVSPSYTRDYPFVIARGEGAVVEDVDGNRFLDCAAGIAVNSTGRLASRGRQGDRRAGREVHPHVGDRLLLRAAGAPRGGAGAHRADRRRRADVLRQLRHRGDRGGAQAVALSHEAAGRHRVPRRVPRPLARRAVADGEQGDPAPRLRPVHARRLSRAVSRTRIASTAAPTRARRVPRSFIRDQILVHLVVARRGRRRSSSSRSRARAATSCRRRRSSRGCAS